MVAKTDLLDEAELAETLAFAKKHLAAIVPEPAIFPVSAKRALAGDRAGSGMDAFVAALGATVENQRRKLLLDHALADATRVSAFVRQSLAIHRRSLELPLPELEQRIGRAHERLRTGKKVLETAAATVRAETAALKARVRQDLADFTAELRTAVTADIDTVDAADIRRYLSFFVQDTWKAWTESEGGRISAELEKLAETVIQVANENVREVLDTVTTELGPADTKVEIKVDTLKYDASIFALGALGTTVFLFVDGLAGGVLTLAAPILAFVLRGKVAAEVKVEAKAQAPLAVDRVAALVGPKLDEIVDGFGARLLEFVAQAGDTLTRGISEVLDRALRDRRAADATVSATADAAGIDGALSALPRDRRAHRRGSPEGLGARDRLMGILDRIAGTLDELTGDGRAAIADEIARARARGRGRRSGARRRPARPRSPGGHPTCCRGVSGARRAAGGAGGSRGGNRAARTRRRSGRRLRGGVVRARRGAGRPGTGRSGARCAPQNPDPGLRQPEPAPARHRGARPGSRHRRQADPRRARAAQGDRDGRPGQWRRTDDRRLALEYGRVLARLGEREASEWLTRAARAENADPAIFAEAAAVAPDDGRAEALLREGLGRAPANVALRAAMVGLSPAHRPRRRGGVLAETAAAEAPADPRAWAAMREAATRTGRWRQALDAAAQRDRARRAAATGSAPGAGARRRRPGRLDRAFARRAVLDRRALNLSSRGGRRSGPAAARTAGSERDEPPVRRPRGRAGHAAGWTAGRAPHLGARVRQRHACAGGLATAVGRAAEAFDRPLLVAVMGEFNAGKSSFVNALCGEEVAPTGVTPTTATINVLRYGATPEARVVHHDGSARAIPAADLVAFLGTLRDADASEVRLVEIFLPVEALRRVEIVDTPGLNSIRPEHERVARDFLRDADAIVWVFAAGQAAKATEREALTLAHAAGKRVVGVLNKIDRAEPGEVSALVRHVEGTLGDLVEPVVPFSATRATAAQKAGRSIPGSRP